MRGLVPKPGVNAGWVRVGGYNTAPVTVPVTGSNRPADSAEAASRAAIADPGLAEPAPGLRRPTRYRGSRGRAHRT